MSVAANGEILVKERERRGLTKLRAAVAIGISPQTLQRAEAGLAVQPKSLREIAEYYGLDPAALAA